MKIIQCLSNVVLSNKILRLKLDLTIIQLSQWQWINHFAAVESRRVKYEEPYLRPSWDFFSAPSGSLSSFGRLRIYDGSVKYDSKKNIRHRDREAENKGISCRVATVLVHCVSGKRDKNFVENLQDS